LLDRGASTPPTSFARTPVTTMLSRSKSIVPVDCASAADGTASATAALHRRMERAIDLPL
jgi:hypothetical protein